MQSWWAVAASQAAIAIALFWPACTSLAQPESSKQIELRTEIFGPAGIHVATNRTRIETGGGHYGITADVTTRGIATLIADVATHSDVSGTFASGEPRPLSYRGEVQRGGDKTQSWVDYRPDGSAVGGSSSAEPTPRPIPPGPIAGTTDQLTAFYVMERKLARLGSCLMDLTVFDGRRLYKLHFSDAGSETLDPSGAGFSGATRICRFEREAIAGFRDISGRNEGISEGKLWCARLIGDELAIPVRMELTSEFGGVTGELAELRAPGAALHFGE